MVADLIESSTRSWKEEFVRQTFFDVDANRILKFHLANS